MKKNLTILLILTIMSVLCSIKSNAQITYKHSFNLDLVHNCTPPIIINLGGSEYKYFYVDYIANQIKLFNLDFTPYFTINVPVTLAISGVQIYYPGYVTRTLFDCDTNMFEYAIMPSHYTRNFYVFRQDGTLLFQKDSTLAIYSIGTPYNCSYDVRPINNTPEGAILFLGKPSLTGDIVKEEVYSLCGSLPENIYDFSQLEQTFIKIYPNPTAQTLTFQISLPDNINKYELVLLDNTAKVVKRQEINFSNDSYDIDVSNIKSGMYFYSLSTKTKIFQTGKFIITK